MDASCLLADDTGLKEDLRAAVQLAPNIDEVAVEEDLLHFSTTTPSATCKPVSRTMDNIALRHGGGIVVTLIPDVHQMLDEILDTKIEPKTIAMGGMLVLD